jgi:hypothetical protein
VLVVVARLDRGGLLASPVSGTLYEGRAARTHSTFTPLTYASGKTLRSEYRDLDGLKQIIEQLPGLPVTLNHPSALIREGGKPKIIGKVVGARLENDHAVASIMIFGDDGSAEIIDGMHELSLGYSCAVDDNGFQRSIESDHLAVVPKARCVTCQVKMDAWTSTDTDCQDCMNTDAQRCAFQSGVEPGCTNAQADAKAGGQADAKAAAEHEHDCGCDSAPDGRVPCAGKDHAVISSVMAEAKQDATLNAAERHHLPGSMFAIPGREGMPLEDAGHVKDAMARFGQEHWKGPAERKAAYHHIIARAHQLGIDPSGFEKKHAGKLDDDEDTMDEGTEHTIPVAPLKRTAEMRDMTLSAKKADDSSIPIPSYPGMDDDDPNVLKIKTTLDAAMLQLAAVTTRADAAEKALEVALTAQKAAEIVAREATKNEKLLQTRVDSADADIKAAKDASDAAIAAAELAKKTHMDAAFTAQVVAKVEVLKNAEVILGIKDKDGKPFDHLKKSDRDLKIEIARHVDGADSVLDTDSDDAVDAFYRGALKRHSGAKASKNGAFVAIEQMRSDTNTLNLSASDRERAAKAAMNAQAETAWLRSK